MNEIVDVEPAVCIIQARRGEAIAMPRRQPLWPKRSSYHIDAAIKHCEQRIGIWGWASNDRGASPDGVLACAGDVPRLETLAAMDISREEAGGLRIRVVNVVDLMTLQPKS